MPKRLKKKIEEFEPPEFSDVQDGLVQLGDSNFYATSGPQEPDYANPFSPEPLSITPSIIADGCNFGVQLDGTLFFINVPSIQIVWRNPNCQPPPPPPPLEDDVLDGILAPKGPALCNSGVFINIVAERYHVQEGYLDRPGIIRRGEYYSYLTVLIKPLRSVFPKTDRYVIPGPTYEVIADFYIEFFIEVSSTKNSAYVDLYSNLIPERDAWLESGGTISGDIYEAATEWKLEYSYTIRVYFNTKTRHRHTITLSSSIPGYIGGDFDYFGVFKFMGKDEYDTLENRIRVYEDGDAERYEKETVIRQFLFICKDENYVNSPPPPKIPSMDCCNELKTLVKLLIKRVGNLPASVPDNFTKQEPTMINVESLAELMFWQMEQLDKLMGAYPIDIEIEDSDLVKEGNQKQKISLPNQAEAIAEIVGLMLTIKRDTHATLVTAIKAMGEAGMTKNLAVKTLDVALANAEFLGYELKQIEKEVPSLFTPGGKNITETLKEKNVKIISYDNTDKNDLQDDLKMLKTMAARWNAQNWRKAGSVESLKQTLFGNLDAIANEKKEEKQPDFNDFTEDAERGFITTSGITDSTNPWGRPYAQRPKIREIGTDKGRYDKDGKPI